jgi:hypothetical protein
MAGPVLIVELPITDTTRADAVALVQACSAGLGGEGRCELAAGDTPADGVAVVSLRGDGALGALIEVGSRRGETRAWRSQELRFQPQDARVERFRTLGLAIATLYTEARLEDPSAASGGELEKPATPAATEAKHSSAATKSAEARVGSAETSGALNRHSSDASTHNRGWLSVGPVTAYDHQLPSAFRYGGQLSLGAAPLDLPLFASLGGSYAVGRILESELSSPVSLSWATIGAGLGGYLPLGHDIQLRVSLQGVLVKLEAHGSDSVQGEQESQRWLMGGQAGFELVAWASRRWGASFGPQLQQLTGATAIAVHGRPIATVAALSFQLGASFELRPFQP